MSKKIIGNTKIELTNVRTGKKEVYEKHNMLTNYLSNLLSINPWGTVKSDCLMPLVGRVLGGVALFPERKVEDINNNILFNDFTAYAQINANGTTDTRRGNFNFTESGPIVSGGKDGYKLVWDWTTSQGNGTYNCVALTNPYIDKNLTLFNPTTNYGSSYGYNSWSLSSSDDTNAFNVLNEPQLYDKETGIFYRLQNINSTSLTIHKARRPMSKILLGEAPLYGRTSATSGFPAAIVDGVSAMTYDYENRNITFTKSIMSSSYCNSCSFRKEGGIPYVYIFSIPTSASASFQMTKINLDTYEVEEMTKTYSGASFKAQTNQTTPRPELFPFVGNYIYLPKKDASANYSREAFYKVNVNDVSDITTIAIPQEIQDSDAKDVFVGINGGYIMKNDYGFWWIKRRQYNTSAKYTVGICNDEMVLLNTQAMFSGTSGVNSSFNIDNAWITHFYASSGSAVSFIPELNNYYMATINNLASPITKTSEQLMKITYTLTEVDE